MEKIEEVSIIGAGPSGISTAIQLKRYGIEPVIFEKNRIGGLLLNANLVENYPGFPEGVSGIELVKLFEEHLKNSGIEVYNLEVTELDFEEEVFLIYTKDKLFRSKIVVIASGTKPKEFSRIPGNVKDRIFYEIYPLFEVRNKKIVIVGGGDAAFDYALNLSEQNETIILNRSRNRKCLPLLWERVTHSHRITYYDNSEIVNVKDLQHGLRLVIQCRCDKEKSEFFADYLVFAIGREPQIDYFSEKLKEDRCKLNDLGRLYFVGDVKNNHYRQTAIAVGDGIYSAMKIYEIKRNHK